jgi:hypothetical protein
MSLHNRQLKTITFELGNTEFQCQIQSWQLVNNTADGDKLYSFCPDGEAIAETEPNWALEMAFYADWTAGGISDFLTSNDGETADFQLDHHEGVSGEHVRWVGTVKIKAPSVGGEVKTTEMTQATLEVIGTPVYSRP